MRYVKTPAHAGHQRIRRRPTLLDPTQNSGSKGREKDREPDDTYDALDTYQFSLLQIVHNCSALQISCRRASVSADPFRLSFAVLQNTFASSRSLTGALWFETCFHLRESSRASVAKSQTHVPCGVVYTQVGLLVANVANECPDKLADLELLTSYLLKVGLFQDGLRRTLKWNANGRLMQLNLHTCTIAKVDSIH